MSLSIYFTSISTLFSHLPLILIFCYHISSVPTKICREFTFLSTALHSPPIALCLISLTSLRVTFMKLLITSSTPLLLRMFCITRAILSYICRKQELWILVDCESSGIGAFCSVCAQSIDQDKFVPVVSSKFRWSVWPLKWLKCR